MSFERNEKTARRIQELEYLLRYWLPDESMIPDGHDEAWDRSIKVLQEGS